MGLKQKQKMMLSFWVFAMMLFVSSFLFAGNNILIKAYADTTTLSGSGVEGDPYLISSVDELKLVHKNLGACYKLVNDIDFKGEEWIPIGKHQNPFKGSFDGNNYEIINLQINCQESDRGLFGEIRDAKISNLTLRNVKISGNTDNVGVLVGDAEGGAAITNCHVRNGEISGRENVGGLIGFSTGGNVEKCSVVANIKSTYSNVGGLIGYVNSTPVIRNSYTLGTIEGNMNAGGIIGNCRYLACKMINCYSATKMKCNSSAGIFGGIGTPINSYYDAEVMKVVNNKVKANLDKLTSAMITKSTFKNWDFDNVWGIDEGTSYPYLKNCDKPDEVIVSSKISEGKGTEEEPYLIRNKGQLKLMRYDIFSCYKFMNDIDLQGEEWKPVGNSSVAFTGNLLGNNHSISNFKISCTREEQGFFGRTGDIKISDLTLRNAKISGNTDEVGAFIGYSEGWVNMTNCHVRNSEICGKEYVGGLIGYLISGNIEKCSVVANIKSTYSNVGGLIGYVNSNPTIRNCYTSGVIEGDMNISGIVGNCRSVLCKIDNCYSAAKMNRSSSEGISRGGFIASSCYYDKDVCGISGSNKYSRTTSQMHTKETFVNWDFDNIWSIDEGSSYPYFKDIDKPEKEEFFYIRTKEDLESMRENKFINYKLMNDIDLEGEEWTPIGTIEKPFEGKFYGSGYSISNFKINNESDNQGLFGCTKDLKINHLKLSNVTINGAKDNVGAIVGNALGKTDIVYCNVENSTISGQSSVGGLAGRVEDGICAMCLSDASITGTVKNVGGFIGKIDGMFRVENCKAIGEICGNENVAGLIGYTDSLTTKIINNYSLSKLTKIEEGLSDTFGGLYNGIATVLSSYYVSDIWDNSASRDDKWSRTLEEMYVKDNYVNWDFNNIWSIRGENVAPYFKIKTKDPGVTGKTVSGILIEDQDGLVTIPGATVNARKESQDGEIEKTVTTDSEGIFRFDSLGIGKYVLEISAEDYITRYFEFDNEKGKDLGDITVKHILD